MVSQIRMLLSKRITRTFRHEVLAADVFQSLDQVRGISAQWRREYNKELPRNTLDGMPSAGFLA
jgi:hypothetical protein